MKKNLLLITSVFVISLTNAQIQYTDIDPDLTLQATNSDSYALDFNSDNSVDLIIYASEVDTNLNGFVLTFIGGVVNTPGSTEIVGTDSLIFGSNILFVDTDDNFLFLLTSKYLQPLLLLLKKYLFLLGKGHLQC